MDMDQVHEDTNLEHHQEQPESPDQIAIFEDFQPENSIPGPKCKVNLQPRHDISALHNPIPFIAEMRKSLFSVSHPIELKHEEFQRYWPYVDNIWVRQHKTGPSKSGNASVDYYGCRLQRATYIPSKKEGGEEQPDREPQRKRRIRQGGTCRARIKVSRHEGLVTCHRIQRIGDQEHSHDLDYSDKLKRNTVVMDVARSEVMKGFVPSSVLTVLQEDEEKLDWIGGKFLSRNDVSNASQRWRLANEGRLGVHPGYRYNASNGLSATTETSTTQLEQDTSLQQLPIQSAPLPPLPADTLIFPTALSDPLSNYLPNPEQSRRTDQLPFITLTYAASLDSSIALGPTIPTPISGPLSKAMTHHLRANHDAILIGVGTAIADNPTLNCRIAGAGGYGGLGWTSQPRPIIIDPNARWQLTYDSKILAATRSGRGKGPWIITTPGAHPTQTQIDLLTAHGGKYFTLPSSDTVYRFNWKDIFQLLAKENIKSIMIEGGAAVINDLLQPENRTLIDSVIITLAPTYLGNGSVSVNLPRSAHPETGNIVPALRFADIKWVPMDEDVIMCGRIAKQNPP